MDVFAYEATVVGLVMCSSRCARAPGGSNGLCQSSTDLYKFNQFEATQTDHEITGSTPDPESYLVCFRLGSETDGNPQRRLDLRCCVWFQQKVH